MKSARRLGLPLIASVLTHAYAGWHLYAARQEPTIKADRDRFEVRMLTLPAPAKVPEPPPPELPEPTRRLGVVERRVKPSAPEPPPVPAPAPEPPPASSVEAPPEAAALTAPPALLAEGTSTSGGGVVQRPGNAIGGLANAVPSPNIVTARAAAPGPSVRSSTAVTRLSDLSRKPRPPSLDAALRRNYPADHRRRGVEGQAEVRVLVTVDGLVGHASVVSESAAGFGRACQDTLLGTQWSEPVSRDGKSVNTLLTYRCRFKVGD